MPRERLAFRRRSREASANNTTDYSARFSMAASQAYSVDTNGQTVTWGSNLTSSGGSLTKTGSGTLTLSGNNTFSGGVTLTAGVVQANSSGALGTSGTIAFNGGQLQYTANNTTDYSARFSMAASQAYSVDTNGQTVTWGSNLTSSGGSLTKTGSGTLTLSGNNTFSGGVNLNAGVVQSNSSGALGTSGTIAFNGGQLQYAANNTTDYSARFSKAASQAYSVDTNGQTVTWGSNLTSSGGSLTKTGNGTLTLSGNNTFSGGVTLTGNGALSLTHSNAAGSGTIFLKSTQPSFPTTVGLSGGITVANPIQIDSTTGRETITSSGTGDNALTGGITITGAGANLMSINNNQSSGNLTVSGGITATSFTSGIQLGGSGGINGILNGAVTTGSGGYLAISSGANWLLNTPGSSYSYLNISSTGNARLGVDNAIPTNTTPFWSSNSTSGALDLNGFNQTLTGLSGGGSNTVTNNGTANSTLTLANLTSDRTFGGVIQDGPTNKVSLVMNSSGRTQTLSGNNTFAGATTISGGILVLGSSLALQNSALDTTASTAGNSTTGLRAGVTTITLGGLTGNKDLASVFTTTSGNYSSVTALTLNPGTGGTNTYSGNITNGAAGMSLTKTGAGTQILSGNNTYSGNTTINSGTLQLGIGSTTGSLSASSVITNNATLVFNRSNTVTQGTDFSSSAIAGTGAITQNGSGTVVFNAANTFSGGVNLNAGVVQVNSSNAIGTTGTIVFNGGQLQYTANNTTDYSARFSMAASQAYSVDTNGQTVTWGSNLTSSGGSLTKNGTGTLTLSGNNTYTGATTINAGNLTILNGNAISDAGSVILANTAGVGLNVNASETIGGLQGGGATGGMVTIAASQILTVNQAADQTFAGIIAGSGALTKNGAGTLTLGGANTYTGATTVNAGVLNIQNASALGTTAAGTTVASGAALQLQGGISVGAEALALSGDGVGSTGALRNISGNNSYAGAITLNAATRINSDAGLLTLSGNIGGAGQNLTVGGAGNTTISGAIATTTGTLTKDGAGTVTLSGNNTYTGATTITGGTLQAASTNALGGTTTIDVNGGSLLVAAANAVNNNANINLNSGTLAVSGNFDETVGALTLSANSIIDFAGFNGTLRFSSIANWTGGAQLSIWNWAGTPQYGPAINPGRESNLVFTTSDTNLTSNLANISFYSGAGTGFVGIGFEVSGFAGGGSEIIAVPEPETVITAVILLLGFTFYQIRLARHGQGLLARVTFLQRSKS